jgi:hypothetical protein
MSSYLNYILGINVTDRVLLLKYIVLSFACGTVATGISGLVQNQPIGREGIDFWGFPIQWRTTIFGTPYQTFPVNFLLDVLLWVAFFFVAIFVLNGLRNF